MRKKNKNIAGFTLIELMITVAILAIIAAIAYPSYQQYVLETRRANAQSDLLELASFMERYYGERFTYVGAVLPFATSPKQGNVTYYNLAVVANSATATTFRLSATPINAQANDRCGTLTVDQTGNHGAAQNDCW